MRSILSAVLWLLTLTTSLSADVKIPSQVSDYSIETFEPDQAKNLDEEKHELTNDIVLELEVSILENNEVNENLLSGNVTALSRPKRSLVRNYIYISICFFGSDRSPGCHCSFHMLRRALKKSSKNRL